MGTKSLSDYSVYIFDLDGTLYDEDDYLRGVYETIAGITKVSPTLAFQWLWENRKMPLLYNGFTEEFGLGLSLIGRCVEIQRTYTPKEKIELKHGAKELLSSLQGKPIYVLTNGNVKQQKNKVANIEWHGLDKGIRFVYANEYKPKPSPLCVDGILYIEGVKPCKVLFIGDSDTDRLCAENSGVDFIFAENIL